jgi:hypothetical protein
MNTQPQISALAYHLYSRKPHLSGTNSTTYVEMTTYLSDTAHQIQGLGGVTTKYKPPISFRLSIDNWGGFSDTQSARCRTGSFQRLQPPVMQGAASRSSSGPRSAG